MTPEQEQIVFDMLSKLADQWTQVRPGANIYAYLTCRYCNADEVQFCIWEKEKEAKEAMLKLQHSPDCVVSLAKQLRETKQV